jgi:hypothetical protein
MRTVSFPVYTFDEIRTYQYEAIPNKAIEMAARQAIVRRMIENGAFNSMLRAIAADWLTNEGWTDLAELRWEDNGPDPDALQFSIFDGEDSRGNGRHRDFVVWTSTRPWTFLATELTVHTKIVGVWEPQMDISVADATGIIPRGQLDPNVARGAREMVWGHAARLVDRLHLAGHEAEEDVDYLSDYATQQGMEFRADGSVYVE